MITWIFLALVATTVALAREQSRSWNEDPMHTRVAGSILILAFSVPAVYALGWLLLPAWGVGLSLRCM